MTFGDTANFIGMNNEYLVKKPFIITCKKESDLLPDERAQAKDRRML